MVLAALIEDFPLCNSLLRRRRPILDFFEDEDDREIRQVFHELPAILFEMSDKDSDKNRKRKSDAASLDDQSRSKVRVTNNGDQFKVTLDTSNYQPDEILVKVVDDKLAISAKHETKRDDVYEFHQMYRCFDLPEGVDPNSVTSKLGANGQLTVEAPVVKPKELSNGRVIPIEMSKDSSASEKSETNEVVTTSVEDKN